MQIRVINKFRDDVEVGDIIELNDRRAMSEIAHGNVEIYESPKKAEKKPVRNKAEKKTYKNKSYKR